MTPYTLPRIAAALITAGLPVVGVGNVNQQAKTCRIDWLAGHPTSAELSQATSVLAGLDWNDTADVAYRQALEPNLTALKNQSAARIAQIDTYQAIGTPTNAQVAAEVGRLSAAQKVIINTLLRTITLMNK